MAFRSDVTVAWEESPRLIAVAAPSTNITLQDLVDTLRDLEDEMSEGLQFDHLLDTSGKGNLGGGGFTGILATLKNAQVLFEPRTTRLETGTVTTVDTNGKVLIDSAATFQANGVTRGDMVLNSADGSHATVLSVTSETELRTLVLAGGTDDQYDFGDGYEIFDYEECTVNGGDLVAVDAAGDPLAPTLNTFGTNLTVELSTSPALIQSGISGLTAQESADLAGTAADAALVRKVVAGRRAVISLDDLTVTFYDDDNTTVIAVFSVSADGRLRERTA